MTTMLQQFRNNAKRLAVLGREPSIIKVLRATERVRRMKHCDANLGFYLPVSYVSVYVNELDGFNDRRLKLALEAFADIEWKSNDDVDWMRREFVGRVQTEAGKIEVSVYAKLKDAPKRCRVIEIDRTTEVIPARVEERVKRMFVCD